MTVADIGAGEGLLHDPPCRARRQGRAAFWPRISCPAVRDRAGRAGGARTARQCQRPARRARRSASCLTASFDRVLMVHMYHEIAQPYEFLWRLRPSLQARAGEVIVVDANRPTRDITAPRQRTPEMRVRRSRLYGWSTRPTCRPPVATSPPSARKWPATGTVKAIVPCRIN